jgi:hypothetical protein
MLAPPGSAAGDAYQIFVAKTKEAQAKSEEARAARRSARMAGRGVVTDEELAGSASESDPSPSRDDMPSGCRTS